MLSQEHVGKLVSAANGAAVGVGTLQVLGYGPALAGWATAVWLFVQTYFFIKKEINKKRSRKRRETDA